jgi:tol-pal system protein YbgF
MQTRYLAAVAALTLIIGAARPADAQSREQRQMMASLQILQEQTQQLALAVAALQQSLEEHVKVLSTRVEDSTSATRKTFADQKLLIDGVASDVRIVRERSDDNNVRITALREELESLRAAVLALQTQPALPALTPPVTSPDGVVAPVPPVAPPVVATAPPAPSTAGLSPTRMLDTAKADYFAGQWSSAINGFEAFLRAFPRSESAGEAQFFIGESQSAQSRWREAVAAYGFVVQNYPTSTSVPDAYYKQGLAYERLGQIDAARQAWDMAVKAYPQSDAGRLARQNLDRLGARRP